ncbi:MAG: fasciclin domain-containing protein [Actinomycetota bacterium]
MKSISKFVLVVAAAALVFAGFAPAAQAQDPDAPSIAEIAAEDGQFSTLVAALGLTGLTNTFADCEGDTQYTVLAPNDAAFESTLGDLGLEVPDLIADPDLVAAILTYHASARPATSDRLLGADGYGVPTIQGEEVTISVSGSDIALINGNPTPANVIAADIQACNGVIHVIDQVLIPPTVAAALGVGGDAAPEELAETGVESAQLAVIGGTMLAAGLMLAGTARRTRRV